MDLFYLAQVEFLGSGYFFVFRWLFSLVGAHFLFGSGCFSWLGAPFLFGIDCFFVCVFVFLLEIGCFSLCVYFLLEIDYFYLGFDCILSDDVV